MKSILLCLIIFLSSFVSCSEKPQCNEFLNSSIIKNVKNIIEFKKTNSSSSFNIVKVIFLNGIDNDKEYVEIRDDISYSEDHNNFELNGHIIIEGIMVGFYNLNDNDYYNRLSSNECLLRNKPLENYQLNNVNPISVNYWTFEIKSADSLHLINTNNKLLKFK